MGDVLSGDAAICFEAGNRVVHPDMKFALVLVDDDAAVGTAPAVSFDGELVGKLDVRNLVDLDLTGALVRNAGFKPGS